MVLPLRFRPGLPISVCFKNIILTVATLALQPPDLYYFPRVLACGPGTPMLRPVGPSPARARLLHRFRLAVR